MNNNCTFVCVNGEKVTVMKGINWVDNADINDDLVFIDNDQLLYKPIWHSADKSVYIVVAEGKYPE